ncbi:kelch repeat-containing protein [Sorangium sp. So ce1014]|uniref:kelch repeat-containing protein n=1 Tax=Sorangium sp. So ce1014 TaxID=3133326 RepID=UPI003F5F0857
MHFQSPFQRWLFILSTWLFGGALLAGGAGCGPEAPAGVKLRQQFPDQAAQVLEASEAFVAVNGGFSLASLSDPSRELDIEAALLRRGGLHAVLPARGEGEIRFHLPGGFEARVRELDAEGEGELAERAVAYPRKGGTSFWSAIDAGYEEWLLLDAGVARADAPAAVWQVEGATLRQQRDAVEVVDETGAARLRVTAPAAYARGGRPIAVRLAVRGATIELWADAGGEPALVDPVWTWAPAMSTARSGHTATVLSSHNVLIVGGYNGAVVASAELYDPNTNSWSPAGSLTTARRYHTATRLSNGRVLIAGGSNASNVSLASAELYDPNTNSWSPAGSLTVARSGHTATTLDNGNGNVLVTGGQSDSSTYLASTELYTPGSNSWSSAAPMTTSRSGHAATRLLDGKVLVAGGRNGAYLTSAALYDPSNNTWSAAGSMGVARNKHTATLLPDGRVLMVGGADSNVHELSSAEIYTPGTPPVWTPAASMATPRMSHTATRFLNGKVLVTGGTTAASTETDSAQMYDPATNTWIAIKPMGSKRTQHTATLLGFSKVLITGGFRHDGLTTGYLASAELYDLDAETWKLVAPMAMAHPHGAAVRLQDGRVLVTGGWNDDGDDDPELTAELYNPTTNTWTSAPDMPVDRTLHTMTLLGNGKVLVVGAFDYVAWEETAALYTPTTNTWSSVGPTGIDLVRNNHTATLLQNGKVLVAGGRPNAVVDQTPTAVTALFNPSTNIWSTAAPMVVPRWVHTATLLQNGKVLVAGGRRNSNAIYTKTADIYDPTTDTWTAAGEMIAARGQHSATRLASGDVLVVGGRDASNHLSTTEIYHPASNAWSAGPAIIARSSHGATPLNDGRVLIAGGQNGTGMLRSTQVYSPVSNTWTTTGPMDQPYTLYSSMILLLADGRVINVGNDDGSVEIYTP